MIWFYILSVIIGYLIGSISPAYILGRVIKDIDIRKYGIKNTGAMNAFQVLGKGAGLTTLILDAVKGVLAMLIAYILIIGTQFEPASLSGIPFIIICLSGFAAILGHDFPFYLKFRGGRGTAIAGGIMIFLAFLLFKTPFGEPVTKITSILLIIIFFGLSISAITGSGNLAVLVSYPVTIALILIFTKSHLAIALSLFIFYSLIVSIISIVQKGLKKDLRFLKKRKRKIKLWRKILRFGSLIFPILYFWLDKKVILVLVGIFFIIFLILDFARKKKKISKIYKKNEPKISGLTLYLSGALIAIAFFQKELAILALIFSAVGDNAAVILGIPFGRTKLFKQKSFQGTIACLAVSFAAGLIAMHFLGVPILVVVIGAIAATIAELFSGKYDNLTIAPFAALIMSLL